MKLAPYQGHRQADQKVLRTKRALRDDDHTIGRLRLQGKSGSPIRYHSRKSGRVSLYEPRDCPFLLIPTTTFFSLAGFRSHFHVTFSHRAKPVPAADAGDKRVPLRVRPRISDRFPYLVHGSVNGHSI